MLFNSYEVLFLFLPVTLAGFFVLSGVRLLRGAAAWLALVSIFFYGYWNPRYVALLLGSIVFNFGAGHAILRARAGGRMDDARRFMVLAIVADMATLGWFKYANFFVDTTTAWFGWTWQLDHVVLPLAISFFTFEQITYLVDAYGRRLPRQHILVFTKKG